MTLNVTLSLTAPLVHGSFGPSLGNATASRRMALILPTGERVEVPVLSGNALRGVLRRIVMRDLLARHGLHAGAGLAGWDALYAALANGGHLAGAESSPSPAAIRDLRADLPELSLFGAALQTWMLAGRLSVGICWPVCRETAQAGLVRVSEQVALLSGEELIEEVSHCRHVDRGEQDPEVSGVTPMPTTMEAIAAGSELQTVVGFRGATDVERSAIAWALDQLSAVGGKSGAGMGAVTVKHNGDASGYAAWRESERPAAKAALADLAASLSKSKPKKKEAKRALADGEG